MTALNLGLLGAVLAALGSVLAWPWGEHLGGRRDGADVAVAAPSAGTPPAPSGRSWWSELRAAGVGRHGPRPSTRGRMGGPSGWVAEFADLTALALEAGLPPPAALELAGTALPNGQLSRSEVSRGSPGDRGGPLPSVLDSFPSPAPGGASASPLAFLATAWSLAEDLGAPAARAARLSAEVLRERDAAEARARTAAAGPRASMWLLTALPLAGPVVGLVLGVPLPMLYARPAALVSAAFGLACTATGWAWARAILGRAARPRRL